MDSERDKLVIERADGLDLDTTASHRLVETPKGAQ
jgi:hypothetical protein